MKASPLLRAWLRRLSQPSVGTPVQFHLRHRWTGWNDAQDMCFTTPTGSVRVRADATILALGGGSWRRLGSDGAWIEALQQCGVGIAPLQPSNCGFEVQQSAHTGWSPVFAERFAGHPLKTVTLSFTASDGTQFQRRGEFVATQTGVEGSLIYAASRHLRDEIQQHGSAHITLNLLPDHSPERVLQAVRHPRGSKSLSSHLKSRLGLDGIKMGLLYEVLSKTALQDPVRLAQTIQALPLTLSATRPINEAISTAGGVRFESLTPQWMLKNLPNVYCAGEMVDWEAPTGGYLLTACMASGQWVAKSILASGSQPLA